jgi:small subunit ribosomal protein S15
MLSSDQTILKQDDDLEQKRGIAVQRFSIYPGLIGARVPQRVFTLADGAYDTPLQAGPALIECLTCYIDSKEKRFGAVPDQRHQTRQERPTPMISATLKTQVITDYRRADNDSGSPEVQVALLTSRIIELTQHLKTHRHDYSSRRGLLKMVSKRNQLLHYLAQTDRTRYQNLIGRLGLRK